MRADAKWLRRHSEGSSDGGFTLIELIIVIVILGILAATVVFAVQGLSGTSAQSACKSDYKTVEVGLESYKAQMGNYPSGSATTAGTTPYTDSESGTAATFTAGAAPTGVNAAASTTGSTGSELFQKGNTAPNTVSASSTYGPWLKDLPVNSGHYKLFVSNDGNGSIQVLVPSGSSWVVPSSTYDTQSISDCSGVS